MRKRIYGPFVWSNVGHGFCPGCMFPLEHCRCYYDTYYVNENYYISTDGSIG